MARILYHSKVESERSAYGTKLTIHVLKTLQIIHQGVRGVPGALVPEFLTMKSGVPHFAACSPDLFDAGVEPKLMVSE